VENHTGSFTVKEFAKGIKEFISGLDLFLICSSTTGLLINQLNCGKGLFFLFKNWIQRV
jgi:hypothetical protein